MSDAWPDRCAPTWFAEAELSGEIFILKFPRTIDVVWMSPEGHAKRAPTRLSSASPQTTALGQVHGREPLALSQLPLPCGVSTRTGGPQGPAHVAGHGHLSPAGKATEPRSAVRDCAPVRDWGRAQHRGHFLQNVPVFSRIFSFFKIQLK